MLRLSVYSMPAMRIYKKKRLKVKRKVEERRRDIVYIIIVIY